MPELPEVETIKCELRPKILGKTIERVRLKPDSLVFRDYKQRNSLPKKIRGKRIKKISRRGKYLLFRLDDGKALVIHLGMSGNVLLKEPDFKRDKHTHLELYFKEFKLIFQDPRRFGRVALIGNNDSFMLKGLARLGPEPLSKNFNPLWLAKKLVHRKATIKSLLLDQRIACGLGNIYSDEACYLAKISPLRPAGNLSQKEIMELVKAIKKALKEAIKKIGCTIQDYKTSEGLTGDYQPRVYGRENQKCHRCRGIIRRAKIGNRSSFYCPNCQH